MNSKEKSDKIKYFLAKEQFDKARELAKDYKLKETEIEIIKKSNYYLATQKAKKYGLYKKAINFYTKFRIIINSLKSATPNLSCGLDRRFY